MPSDSRTPNPEREQTDDSLRIERQQADAGLAEKLSAIECAADAVIEKARARADDVIARERAKVDRQSASVPAGRQRLEVEKERRLADEVVREERADADEALRTERAQDSVLLAAQRDDTDKDLSHERARSDNAVATRDDFLGFVSHDLRNMLGTIIGSATLIAQAEGGSGEPGREQVRAHALRIQRSGARMTRLVGDLVDVASIEAGALAVTPQLGDPALVVTEAVETLQAHAAAAGVSVIAEVASTSLLVRLDAPRILQVLANLLGNALKFTPAGGRVVVRVERVDDDVRFSVRDTGIGIAAHHQDLVFERFRQVAKDDRRGVGLGLYISKCIVEGHGGRIWVESRRGQGSTFSFTLPAPPPRP
jgi:signal transduction histidine kinase